MDSKKEGFSKNIKQESENDSDVGSANTNQFSFSTVNSTNNPLYFKRENEIDIDICHLSPVPFINVVPTSDTASANDFSEECKAVPETTYQQDSTEYQLSCRLCAQSLLSRTMHYLYEDVSDSLAFKINFALPINVEQNDGFPEFICTICKMKLEAACEFARFVVSVDSQIRFR